MLKRFLAGLLAVSMAALLCACEVHINTGDLNVSLPGGGFSASGGHGQSGEAPSADDMSRARQMLKDTDAANEPATLVEKYGSVLFTTRTHWADGVVTEPRVYADGDMHMEDGSAGFFVDDGGDVWGIFYDEDAPFRYVFPGNYDTFLSSDMRDYDPYSYDPAEEPVLFEDLGGEVHIVTERPANDVDRGFFERLGYDPERFSAVVTDYCIDADTLEQPQADTYAVRDDGLRVLLMESLAEPGAELPELDPAVWEKVAGADGMRHAVIHTGGQEYEATVGKGCMFKIWLDGYEECMYADPECTVPCSGDMDLTSDAEVWLKEAEDAADMERAREILKDMDVANDINALVARHGSAAFTDKSYPADGSVFEIYTYVDPGMYARREQGGFLVDEGGDVWGCWEDDGAPCRYVFPGNYDRFLLSDVRFCDPYIYDPSEEPVSYREQEGEIFIAAEFHAVEIYSGLLESLGYDPGDVSHMVIEYDIDAGTLEMLHCDTYAVLADGGRALVTECSFEGGVAPYEPDQDIRARVFNADARHVTVTAGGEEYEASVGKGCEFRVWMDGYGECMYDDPECAVPHEGIDSQSDVRVWLKEAGE